MKTNLVTLVTLVAMMCLSMNAMAAVTITSNAIEMNVFDEIQPVITTQPTGVYLYETETINLSVVATGGGLHYAWYRDGVAVGEDSPNLEIPDAEASDTGPYTCVVSNSAPGSIPVTSLPAGVVVYVHPTIMITSVPEASPAAPADGVLNAETGTDVVYTVEITPDGLDPMPTVELRWYKDGVEVTDAVMSTVILTNDTMTLVAVTADGDNGVYTCQASCTAVAPAAP